MFFFIGWFIYRLSLKKETIERYTSNDRKPLVDIRVGSGFDFWLCLFLIFFSRIFIELTKENQVDFESGMMFNMGQLLSVPFVLLGLYCMFGGKYCRRISEFK